MKRVLSPALFVLITAAFFLPFLTVSCQAPDFGDAFGPEIGEDAGQLPQGEVELASATGFQLATGNVDVNEEFGQEFGDEAAGVPSPDTGDEPELWAIVALAAAVLGIGLSIPSGTLGSVSTLALGGVGALSLFLMKNRIDGELGQAGAFGFQVKWEIGFWVALLLFIAAAAVGTWRLLSGRKAEPATPEGMAGPPPGGVAPPASGPPPGGGPATPPPPPPPPPD